MAVAIQSEREVMRMHVFRNLEKGEAFCQHMKQFRQFLGLVCLPLL